MKTRQRDLAPDEGAALDPLRERYPGARVTVVARWPDQPERTVILTDDRRKEVVEALLNSLMAAGPRLVR